MAVYEDPDSASSGRPFLRHLPAWITRDENYRTLKAPIRHTLNVIAGRCWQVLICGTLVACLGGVDLEQAIGISSRTFDRHLNVLESRGFVVTVGRGGCWGTDVFANAYAIPGQRGQLDSFQVVRRKTPRGRGIGEGLTPPAPPARFNLERFIALLHPKPPPEIEPALAFEECDIPF